MRSHRPAVRFAAAALVCLAAAVPAFAASPPSPPVDPWKEVDRLVSELKMAEASREAEKILTVAREAGDAENWTRALIRTVLIRMALRQYGTGLDFLRSEPWPEGTVPRAVLNLFQAQTFLSYYRSSSWEINQRERVESKEPLGIDKWTRDQIAAAAVSSYLDVWQDREALDRLPVSRLAEYLEPNDYPAEVRGTLRDAVSYLFADLLADSSLWTPREDNQVGRLDFAQLAGGSGSGGAERERLADPAVHPLVKLAAVLGDLEAWHAGSGNRNGALEARRVLLKHLYDAAATDADKRIVRDDLERRLPAFRDVPWWSMGMATLAELYQGNVNDADEVASAPLDALARAHAIAAEGAAAFPDSPGGRRSLRIAREIERPQLDVTSMSSDGLAKRSLQVVHKNLPAVYFRAYPIDVRARFENPEIEEAFPDGDDLRRRFLGRKPLAAWRVDLPPTPDFRTHVTYVTPPLDQRGAYVILASPKDDFHKAKAVRRISAVRLILGDLVLLTRMQGTALEVTALSGATGRPFPGAKVRFYQETEDSDRLVPTTRTAGADGVVTFESEPESPFFLYGWGGNDGAAAAADIAWLASDESQEAREPTEEIEETEETASFLYTDRSVYRPTQKILWKVLAYRGRRSEGRFETLTGKPVTVTLFDAGGNEVAAKTVTTNGFGTASGEFEVPAGRALGNWSLASSEEGAAFFRVEEYKRPTFEVTFDDPAEPLRLGHPSAVTGRARYYFGLPVTGGKVHWEVRRDPVRPRWWGYDNWFASEEEIASGTSSLDADGTFRIELLPESAALLGKDAAEVTYRYLVSADVVDTGGETHEAERSFRVGNVAVEARFSSETGFFRAGLPMTVTLTRADLNGSPRPGEGTWTLFELRQPERALPPSELPLDPSEIWPPGAERGYRTPGDALRPRWEAAQYSPERTLRGWEDGRQLASGTVLHDTQGRAEVTLPAGLSPGAYRLRYETLDEFGGRSQTYEEILVAGAGTGIALPAVLEVEESSVPAGGTARFFVHSGIDGLPLYFETYRDGRLTGRRLLEGGSGDPVIEVPVRAEDRGGFQVRVVGVTDHQRLKLEAPVFVPWDDRQLTVELSTFRDTVQPGARETWRVTVKKAAAAEEPAGAAGTPEALAAELLAYMYDRSLDAFADHEPPDPYGLFPNRTLGPQEGASLGEETSSWVVWGDWAPLPREVWLREDRLRFFKNWRIGGLGRSRLYQVEPDPEYAEAVGVAEEIVVDSDVVAPPEVSPLPAPPPPPPPPPAPVPVPASTDLRSDFAETAFWQPHLLAGPDGSAAIEFTVSGSVTAWNVWVHAVTRDLRSGSVHRGARSVRDLMVRPYLPRFLREGDNARLKVVVNNASQRELSGEVTLDILDPETGESRLDDFGLEGEATALPFTVAAGGSADLTFPVWAPRITGTYNFKVTAVSGDLGDGELRTLPVLPSRLHLTQSRFAALKGKETRTLRFEDLEKGGDETLLNEQMVVTIDGQLFYSVLEALPYLVNYPYECSEQTLNRFVSTGIVASLFDRYPSVATMAQELSKRETRFETWGSADPNRKMALEETPWLQTAQGGSAPSGDDGSELVKVLDPRIARAERDAALAKLAKTQLANGAFPWWPGGPESPYMTVYLLHGFAKAAEHGVPVPREMVQKGWTYLARYFREQHAARMEKAAPEATECCWEILTFLVYVASSYPDPSWMGEALTAEEQSRILDGSFRRWRDHSPYLKALLAMTLQRKGRTADARLVLDSVLDSAKTTRDEGTFWQPEERSWLWYNDTIEGHAFVLRALMEIAPDDPRKDGLVQWLFLNKKLNHWKSTRATAEVLYALVHYLEKEGQLGVRQAAAVRLAGQTTTFTFEPDRYTGKKNQIVVPGEKIDPARSAVVVEQETPGFLFASATWHFSTEELPKEARGDLFTVSRHYFRRVSSEGEAVLQPLAEGAVLQPGDEVEVQLTLTSRAPAEYVHLKDPRPAGFEPGAARSGYRWDLGLARYEETRDSGTNFFFETLPAGTYTLRYRVRANLAGTFRAGPATVQSMYAPEFTAYSAGETVEVRE